MDNHKKKRLVTYTEDDIISNFSEDLIDMVLERLPIEDIIRTSILSKKWRYRWTAIRVLVFYNQFMDKLSNREALHHNGFIRTINKILINHQSPIFKFVLLIPKIVLDSFQEVDQWMLILSRKNVNELLLCNLNRIYLLPSSVFSCLDLRRLTIHKCIFKLPREFQGFPHIEHIRLWNVSFESNSGGTVINLPQLKSLNLKTCSNVNNFHIKALKLRYLHVVNCPDIMLLRFLHSGHLVVVRICLLKPIENIQEVERFGLSLMLSKMPNIVDFTVDGYLLKFLAAEKFPKQLPHVVKCLTKLEFQTVSFGDLDQVQGVFCLLRNTANLKALHVTHMQTGTDAEHELAFNYLESSHCLKIMPMLQTVEITSLEGSRSELLFIKLLLDHAPHLENMIIRPSATADADQRLNIAKGVMSYPRASTKAKVVYLDPQP